jgi:hypothetical protein
VAVKRNSSEGDFQERFNRDRPDVASKAEEIIRWARERQLRRIPRAGEKHDTLLAHLILGVTEHKIFTLETNGAVWVLFKQLGARFPSTDAQKKEAFFNELRHRLRQLPGRRADIKSDADKASWNLQEIDLQGFLGILDWLLSELRRHDQDLRASKGRS